MTPCLLFGATLLTTTFAGLFYAGQALDYGALLVAAAAHPRILIYGLPFSLTFLGILLVHELGHYFACRYYFIKCTPPFFIPFPISIAGTLGAFIRIKSEFPHKRALFDVGIAGPLAGFGFLLPMLFLGIRLSELIPRGSLGSGGFGEPLLFRWFGQLILGYEPATQDLVAHPIAMAAWFGMLATCLNLLPVWQLDGGHIAYAVLGRRLQKKVSILGAFGLIGISFWGWPVPSYLIFGLLLLILGARFKFYHPPTLFDEEELGRGRLALALAALLVLVVCFTPVPITF